MNCGFRISDCGLTRPSILALRAAYGCLTRSAWLRNAECGEDEDEEEEEEEEEEEAGIRGGLGRILGRWSLLRGRGLFGSSIGCR